MSGNGIIFVLIFKQNQLFFIMAIAIIILVVVVLLVIWGVSLYNNLVKLKNNRENAFANIDVQLKQRHDLVPQLVSTVKDTPRTSVRYCNVSPKPAPLQWELLALTTKSTPRTRLPARWPA